MLSSVVEPYMGKSVCARNLGLVCRVTSGRQQKYLFDGFVCWHFTVILFFGNCISGNEIPTTHFLICT